jgi:hypothetical protein
MHATLRLLWPIACQPSQICVCQTHELKHESNLWVSWAPSKSSCFHSKQFLVESNEVKFSAKGNYSTRALGLLLSLCVFFGNEKSCICVRLCAKFGIEFLGVWLFYRTAEHNTFFIWESLCASTQKKVWVQVSVNGVACGDLDIMAY